MDTKLSRRYVLQQSAAFGALVLAGATGCGKEKKELSCTDTTALSAGDAQVRTALQYVDAAPDAAKECDKCQQFIAGAPDACGTCKVVKGPINPKGYCKSFVAKPA